MPKPLLGSQILQDTFEKIQDQAQDVPQTMRDVVVGQDQNRGDSGIELQGGKTDPTQLANQAQQQGLTPQQLVEKEEKKKEEIAYHQEFIQKIDKEQAELRRKEKLKAEDKAKQEKAQEQQKIVQLREEEAKAAVLQPPPKPKQGRGTAFLPVQAKAMRGTGELAKTPTN